MGELAGRMAATSIGYVPITARRGGITYPTPKETHTMTDTPRPTKAQLSEELRVNNELMAELRKRRDQIKKDLAKAIPAEPTSMFSMFRITLRYEMRGPYYDFLIMRAGDTYYTTGTRPGQMRFENWAALMGWLEGPEVYSHTDLEILRSADKVVSFDTGTIVDHNDEQVPF